MNSLDSGTTEGRKYDAGKIRLELLDADFLLEVGRVLTFGATKYNESDRMDETNWRKGMRWGRLIGGGMRHLLAFSGGENDDPETGLSHLAHATCCLMFLFGLAKTHSDLDDRVKS